MLDGTAVSNPPCDLRKGYLGRNNVALRISLVKDQDNVASSTHQHDERSTCLDLRHHHHHFMPPRATRGCYVEQSLFGSTIAALGHGWCPRTSRDHQPTPKGHLQIHLRLDLPYSTPPGPSHEWASGPLRIRDFKTRARLTWCGFPTPSRGPRPPH